MVVTPSGAAIDGTDFSAFDTALAAAATAAGAGVSYDAATNTLSFDGTDYAGTDFAFTVNATADTLVEGDETFTATLSAPSNATLGATASAIVVGDGDVGLSLIHI